MPGFHTPNQESPKNRLPIQNEGYHLRRAFSPTMQSRPGTPQPVQNDVQCMSISRPSTPIRSRVYNARSPPMTPSHNGHRFVAQDMKQWALVWDNDKQDFVRVPLFTHSSKSTSDPAEDVDLLNEFVFVLEESTPTPGPFDATVSLRGPFGMASPSIMEKQNDPNSSFLEFDENEDSS